MIDKWVSMLFMFGPWNNGVSYLQCVERSMSRSRSPQHPINNTRYCSNEKALLSRVLFGMCKSLSQTFQLYRYGWVEFYWWGKPEYPEIENNTDLLQVAPYDHNNIDIRNLTNVECCNDLTTHLRLIQCMEGINYVCRSSS